MTTASPRRLAVLLTHPIQYFKPVFQGLAANPALELLVVFGCDHGSHTSFDPDFGVSFAWDSSPTSGFPHQVISRAPLEALSDLRRALPLARRAAASIAAFQPDAVLVFSYSPAFIRLTTLLLAQQGQRLWLRAETTDVALQRSGLKQALRSTSLRAWYRLFDHVFPIGSHSQAHYRRLGVPQERQSTARYAVDVDFFAPQVAHWRPQRQALRQELGLAAHSHVLLYVGKISPVKDPLLIAAALEQLKQDPARAALLERLAVVVVGDGQLRPELEQRLEQAIPGRWHGMGFQNQQNLGRCYALADTLLLPSRSGETWGLVVNEALQFGLNVICSDRVGSAPDLVAGRHWGRVHRSGDAADLAAAIAGLIEQHPQAPGPAITASDLPHPRKLVKAIEHQLLGESPPPNRTAQADGQRLEPPAQDGALAP
jgi:glycosyltransferase involved in cell wall biosynthesis